MREQHFVSKSRGTSAELEQRVGRTRAEKQGVFEDQVMLGRGAGTTVMLPNSSHGLVGGASHSSFIQQQFRSSASSSLPSCDDNNNYYYQDILEEQGVLDCCFYGEDKESSDEEAIPGVPRCEEGSTDSNPVQHGVLLGDGLIGFGTIPTYEQNDEDEWEELDGIVMGAAVLDSSADAQSGSGGSKDTGLLVGPQQQLQQQQQQQTEDEEEDRGALAGAELVNLLVACAEAVSAKSVSLVHQLLLRLGELASPDGATAMERVAAYFTEGLACRVANERPDMYRPLQLDLDPTSASSSSACSDAEDEAASAFHVLNHVSPMVKFGHFSANDAILRAFEGHVRVHVIDLDVGQGLQWPALFQGLASRPGGPPARVRISGVGPFKDGVEETGDRLAEFARALGLDFEFHPVIDRLDDVRLWMLHVKEGEAVAVNCIGQLHRSQQDVERIKGVLELIRSTKPVVVAVVEQEASHNGGSFEARFAGSLRYYAAVFDALDSSMLPPNSRARVKVERTIFAREIRNIVACEGEERVERHERFQRWGQLFEAAGFRNAGLSRRAVVQARLLLQMFACKDYTLKEVDDAGLGSDCCGGITLGWLDQPLLTASAWAVK